MTVIWTRHAQERQQEWQKRLGVTRQEVEALVANPGQIVPGDGDAMVAQGRHGEGLYTGRAGLSDIGRGERMRVKYDPEADVLVLILRDEPPVDSAEEPGGVILSYGGDGQPVSVELLNASSRKLVTAGELSVTLEQAGTR